MKGNLDPHIPLERKCGKTVLLKPAGSRHTGRAFWTNLAGGQRAAWLWLQANGPGYFNIFLSAGERACPFWNRRSPLLYDNSETDKITKASPACPASLITVVVRRYSPDLIQSQVYFCLTAYLACLYGKRVLNYQPTTIHVSFQNFVKTDNNCPLVSSVSYIMDCVGCC